MFLLSLLFTHFILTLPFCIWPLWTFTFYEAQPLSCLMIISISLRMFILGIRSPFHLSLFSFPPPWLTSWKAHACFLAVTLCPRPIFFFFFPKTWYQRSSLGEEESGGWPRSSWAPQGRPDVQEAEKDFGTCFSER